MKKILSFLLVFAMIFSMCGNVLAASSNTLTFHLTYDDEYEQTVPTGTTITVEFTVENDSAKDITLKRIQNEIYYDHEFFEFVEGSAKVEKNNAGLGSSLKVYSTNEHRVYVNSLTDAAYAPKELVASFKLLVLEDEIGAWSIIETKAQKATDTDGDISTINEKNLKIIIGEPDPNEKKCTITYFDGSKELYRDTVISGNTTTLRPAPEKDGYKFTGWKIDNEVQEAGSDFTVTKNVTATAQWALKEKYTLSFDTDGGKSVTAVSAYEGETIMLTQTTSKLGYTFNGWYKDSAKTNKVLEIVLTEDTTVYAKFTKDSDGGDENGDSHHPSTLITEHVSYIIGRTGGKIAPRENITRAEVVTIFFRLLTEEVRNENYTKENVFKDVSSDNWFNAAVSTLAKLGIVKGRTLDTFAPNEYISRAEFTTIAARFSDAVWDGEDLFPDISAHWARDYINAAASIGWIVGIDGYFRPNDNITRAEVMTLVNRMLERQPETKEDLLPDMTVWVDNMDETAWYYLAVQEATNSHDYDMKADGVHEKWTKLTENPDWADLQK